jgi:hypothetical protein
MISLIKKGYINSTALNKWVILEDVQFQASEKGRTYSGEEFDEFDGERRLVQCKDYRSILLSTSIFADFKSIVLPDSAGKVEGVLTRDFFGEKYILKPNEPKNIYLTDSRCDPFFEASFETQRLGSFDHPNWTNYREEGTQFWEVYEDENSLGQFIRIGSYRSGDKVTTTWLISPKIEIKYLHQPQLSFRTSTSFADSSELEALISKDWDGDPLSVLLATWEELVGVIANKEDDPTQWIDSGEISLEGIPAFHLAFRYTGSGKSSFDGTYELDDIRVYELK